MHVRSMICCIYPPLTDETNCDTSFYIPRQKRGLRLGCGAALVSVGAKLQPIQSDDPLALGA